MNKTQTVDLLYFAWVRERMGHGRETVAVPEHVETVADLMTWLSARDERSAAAFAHPSTVRAAIDRVHAQPGARLAGAREIAFFPPVTGG